MPRNSLGNRSSSSNSSSPINIKGPSRPYPPAPHSTPVGSPPTPISHGPSFMQSIKQGLGFGMGSAIAHNIFDGKKVVEHVHTTPEPNKEYAQCMKESNDAEGCKHLLNRQDA